MIKQEVEKICKNCIYWTRSTDFAFEGECYNLRFLRFPEDFFCKDFTEKEEK